MSTLTLRIISALVLAPAFFALVAVGQLPFLALCTAIVWISASELAGMRPQAPGRGDPPDLFAPAWISLLLLGTYFVGARILFVAAPVLLLSAAPAWFRADSDPDALVRDLCWRVLCTVYLGLVIFWVLLRLRPDGLQYFLLAVGSTWASDICAYFVGRILGKTPLSPAISPNKTFAGAGGGLVAGGAAGGVFAVLTVTSIPAYVGVGILLAAAGQLGDLFASVLKRAGRADDSGSLIPGHGGALDRLDGLLLSVPVLFLLLEMGIL